MNFTLKAGLLTGVMMMGAALPAAAEITLRVGDSFPVGHLISEHLAKHWMQQVTEKSAGAIKFEHFPAEQMGKAKDLLELTKSGVLDIGYVGASYVSDKLPLSSVGELPEDFANACEGTKAFWQLVKPGGVLDKAEFAPNGVRVLLVMVLPPYQIYTKDRPLTGLDSFKGLKIRTTGGAKEIATKLIGGTPVQMAAPDTRDALSRGTLDALLFPTGSIRPYELQSLVKYSTTGLNFGSFVVTYTISQTKWDSLTPEVQTVLTEVAEEANLYGCAKYDEIDAADTEVIRAAGAQYVEFSPEEAKKVGDLMATVGDQWAAEQESRGKPANEVLAAFRAELAKLK